MTQLRYTTTHEWVRVENGEAVVGVSEHAQEAMGELVYVELPDVGRQVSQGEEAGVLESVKAASEVYAPVGGEVTAVNESLNDDPTLVSQSALDAGWLFRIRMDNYADLDELLDAAGYLGSIED